jgi:hypothetical protein
MWFFSPLRSILCTKTEKRAGDQSPHYDNSIFPARNQQRFEYELRQADDYDISITSRHQYFESIRVTQSGEPLSISLDSPDSTGISSVFNRD